MSLRTTLSDAAVEYVRSYYRPAQPTIDDIVDYLIDSYRGELAAEGERTIREFVRAAAKSGLADKRDRDQPQLTFAGFDIPTAITVPLNEGQTVYVAFENATRAQAHAHIAIKDANIAAAIEERRTYVEFLDRLDTVWKNEPWLTAGEVLRRLS